MTGGGARRSVGRPKKVDRDAAVFIARWWRTECLKESVADADAWIIEHWADHTPRGEKPGITDGAHVRAAVKRARETWLKDAVFHLSDGWRIQEHAVAVLDPARTDYSTRNNLPGDFELDACSIAAIEFTLHAWAKVMFWAPGMRAIARGKTVPAEQPGDPDAGPSLSARQGRTSIAVVIAELWGQLRLGRLERWHRQKKHWSFGSSS